MSYKHNLQFKLVNDKMTEGQLRWFQQAGCMSDGNLTIKVSEAWVRGEKKMGIPNRRWKMVLREKWIKINWIGKNLSRLHEMGRDL